MSLLLQQVRYRDRDVPPTAQIPVGETSWSRCSMHHQSFGRFTTSRCDGRKEHSRPSLAILFFHKESILKTVKTLFIFVSVVLIGIAFGGCDQAQQMVPPTVEGGGGGTTTPPVEPPTVEPPVVPQGPVVSIRPASVTSPAVGEQLVVEIQVAGAENVLGYDLRLMFDATALRYVGSANGDYLPDRFFLPNLVNDNQIVLAVAGVEASPAESGTLASVTFEVIARKASTLTLTNVILGHEESSSEPHVVNAEISK